MNGFTPPRVRWAEDRFRRVVISLRAWAMVVAGCTTIAGCPQIDRICVENDSDLKVDLLVNLAYPDTTYERALANSYVDPRSRSSIKVVNRKWIDVISARQQVTVLFAEWKPAEFYQQGRPGPQEVFGKLVLTIDVLDSLGWVVRFPQNVADCPACGSHLVPGDGE